MKTCPHYAAQIQDQAVKRRHGGDWRTPARPAIGATGTNPEFLRLRQTLFPNPPLP